MNYNFIVNPSTNRKVSVFSKLGKNIIKNYIYNNSLHGGSGLLEVPEVYLALGKGPLEFPPKDFSKFTPTEEGFLKLLHKNDRHIYKIGTIRCIMDLKKKYGKLTNELLGKSEFDADLTKCEINYLDILNKYNNIKWDTSGKWSIVNIPGIGNYQYVESGTGTILENEMIILGFDNVC